MKDFLEVDGILRPRVNARDLPIHPSPQGLVNFWRWFGDSRCVDAEGRPLVLFYGTGRSFLSFTPSWRAFYGEGIYLTSNAEAASDYAENADGDRPNVLPVYLRATHPYRFDAPPADTEPSNFTLVKTLFRGREARRVLDALQRDGDLADEIRAEIETRGHDGLIVAVPDEPVEYIAFDARSVKSPLGNSGQFDPVYADLCDSSSVSLGSLLRRSGRLRMT